MMHIIGRSKTKTKPGGLAEAAQCRGARARDMCA